MEIEPRNIKFLIEKANNEPCGICYEDGKKLYICCIICFNIVCPRCCIKLNKCPFCRSNDSADKSDYYAAGGLRLFINRDICYGDNMSKFRCDFDCKCNIVECECGPEDNCEGDECEYRYDYSINCDCKCLEHPKTTSYNIELEYINKSFRTYKNVVKELMLLK
jgi:hypothetical protein